ncbi:hypothetical protein J6590_043222 [Homalodisca vitripennis]|nr:hypothetical protein J6590_043222 [Homalodisca vitripennis]
MSENQAAGYLSQNGLKWRRCTVTAPAAHRPEGHRGIVCFYIEKHMLRPHVDTVFECNILRHTTKLSSHHPVSTVTKTFTPYCLDRRPQLNQGKKPKFPQWRPQLLPRKPTFPPRLAARNSTIPPRSAPRRPTFPPRSAPRRPTVPPRSALKWRRKEEKQEHKAEENANQQTVKKGTPDPQETKGSQETDCQDNYSSRQDVSARHNIAVIISERRRGW